MSCSLYAVYHIMLISNVKSMRCWSLFQCRNHLTKFFSSKKPFQTIFDNWWEFVFIIILVLEFIHMRWLDHVQKLGFRYPINTIPQTLVLQHSLNIEIVVLGSVVRILLNFSAIQIIHNALLRPYCRSSADKERDSWSNFSLRSYCNFS